MEDVADVVNNTVELFNQGSRSLGKDKFNFPISQSSQNLNKYSK